MAFQMATPGSNAPAPDLNGPQIDDVLSVTDKYAQERSKRTTGQGMAQYLDLRSNKTHLNEDPWVEANTPISQIVSEGGHAKIIIVGAGFGGILFAVNLIKLGFKPDDIVLVDPAGGFGGNWYWNRYPGLMCDIESYIYMPMLEEMNYMPKRKYASGEELRTYANSICTKYKLHSRAMFQSSVKILEWCSEKTEWRVTIAQNPKGGETSHIQINADFVILANGILNEAKLPNTKDSDLFKGDMFHTARWRYDITGGTFDELNPEMTGLRNKRVGIVGTGATAIQVVPQLARYAKELYVFQRTPSSVDVRNNQDTDASAWKEIASKPGWQKERNLNMFAFLNNVRPKPEVNLVDDEWTRMPSFSALIGGPQYDVTTDTVGDHVAMLHALDHPRQERIRNRVEEIVEDSATAKALQAWYPGWCKRPCFHDEYLQAFNSPSVTLVDTNGKGIDRMTQEGVVAAGKEYEIDIMVWSTGFLPPSGAPAEKAGIKLIGKDGLTLDKKHENGYSTLHGIASRGFPNLFWSGVLQAGASPNHMFQLETQSQHIAYIIAEATRGSGTKMIVEPTAEAEEEWAEVILRTAIFGAALSACGPSYLNKEGELGAENMTPQQQMRAARGSTFGKGIAAYAELLEGWRAKGNLEGLDVKTAP